MVQIANISFDENNRVIIVNDVIDNEVCGEINSHLLSLIFADDKKEAQMKEYKRQPIHFYIDSRGGGAYDAWSIIGVMLNSKTPIYTYCMGYAMSAGFKIFLAGHKRFMSKNAVLMYHQTSTRISGKLNDLIEDVDETKRVYAQYEYFVAERTKIPLEKLHEIADKKTSWYIRSGEAEKYEIAEIIN